MRWVLIIKENQKQNLPIEARRNAIGRKRICNSKTLNLSTTSLNLNVL